VDVREREKRAADNMTSKGAESQKERASFRS
jgi:hypothetical protein